MRALKHIFSLFCVLLFLGGCSAMPIPLGDEYIDPGFKSLNVFLERVEKLGEEKAKNPNEMNQGKVFDILGIKVDSPNVARMSMIDIRNQVFANAQVTGSLKDVEEFRKRLESFSGWKVPYSEVNSKGGFGDFGSAIFTQKEGFNLTLILIFEKDVLLAVNLEGQQSLNEKGKRKLWSSFFSGEFLRNLLWL